MTLMNREISHALALRIAWVAGAVVLALLFLVWPYQHWDQPHLSSVLLGWWHVADSLDGGEWSFCLLMPAVVAWLVYHRRGAWMKLHLEGQWSGLGVMLLGGFFYWVGFKADVGYPGFAAVQLVLAGLILLLGGVSWMRVLLFAWLFMFFMWPQAPLEDYVASPLRVLTAKVSGSFLNAVGVATEQQGSALQSAAGGGYTLGERFSLDVDKACAGLRSLYALMMISALFGYLFLNRWRSRLVLFMCSLPLAMLGNFVRLMLLAIGSIAVDSEFAVGRQLGDHLEMSAFHELAGYAVFAVALGGMFAVSAILERKPLETVKRRLNTSAGMAQDEALSPSKTMVPTGPLYTRVAAAAGVAVVTLALSAWFGGQPPMADLGVLLEMPRTVGNYQRVAEEGMTAAERDILLDDVEMRRGKYLGGTGAGLTAVIVTSGKNRRSLHPPEVCSPAQGYTITSRTPVPIMLEDGRVLEGRLLRMFKDYVAEGSGERRRSTVLQMYLYAGKDGVMANDYYEHVAITYLHAVFKGVNHRWAMVSCVLPVSDERIGERNPVAEAMGFQEVQGFMAAFLPQVLKKS